MSDPDPLLPSLDALAGLPLRPGITWLADRRPTDHRAGDEPLDLIMWADARTGQFREGGMVKRCEARLAWVGSFLEAAQGTSLRTTPFLPERVLVADPVGVETLGEVLVDMGVEVGPLADASPLAPLFEAMARGLEGSPRVHDATKSELSMIRTTELYEFATDFAELQPWQGLGSPPLFAVQGILTEPVWLAVMGGGPFDPGLVAFLDGQGVDALFRQFDPDALQSCASLQFRLSSEEREPSDNPLWQPIQGRWTPVVHRTSPSGTGPAMDADLALFCRIGDAFLRFLGDFQGEPVTRDYGGVQVRWPVDPDDVPVSTGPMNRAARRRMEKQKRKRSGG